MDQCLLDVFAAHPEDLEGVTVKLLIDINDGKIIFARRRPKGSRYLGVFCQEISVPDKRGMGRKRIEELEYRDSLFTNAWF